MGGTYFLKYLWMPAPVALPHHRAQFESLAREDRKGPMRSCADLSPPLDQVRMQGEADWGFSVGFRDFGQNILSIPDAPAFENLLAAFEELKTLLLAEAPLLWSGQGLGC